MRLSYTVMQIWRLKDYAIDFLESRDVIGHVTIRLPGAEFLWLVHSDHASILHRYMAPQILDARTWTQKKVGRMERKRERGRIRKRKRKVEKRKGKGKEKGNGR